MDAHTRSGLIGLLALLSATLVAVAEDPGRPAGPTSGAVVGPAFTSAGFRQETIAATCSKFTSTGTFWSCQGQGAKVTGTRLLIVDNISCRSIASGGLAHTQVDIRQGTGVTYDWTNLITVPMTTTFSLSPLVSQGATVPVTYLVPIGHHVWIDAGLTGTAMASAEFSCTLTGHFHAP